MSTLPLLRCAKRRRRRPRAPPSEATRQRSKEYSAQYRAGRKVKMQELEDDVTETGKQVAAARQEHAVLQLQNGALSSLDAFAAELLDAVATEAGPICPGVLGAGPASTPDDGSYDHSDPWADSAAENSADCEAPSGAEQRGSAAEHDGAVPEPASAHRGALALWVQKRFASIAELLGDRFSDPVLRCTARQRSQFAWCCDAGRAQLFSCRLPATPHPVLQHFFLFTFFTLHLSSCRSMVRTSTVEDFHAINRVIGQRLEQWLAAVSPINPRPPPTPRRSSRLAHAAVVGPPAI